MPSMWVKAAGKRGESELLLQFPCGASVFLPTERTGDVVDEGRNFEDALRPVVESFFKSDGTGVGPHHHVSLREGNHPARYICYHHPFYSIKLCGKVTKNPPYHGDTEESFCFIRRIISFLTILLPKFLIPDCEFTSIDYTLRPSQAPTLMVEPCTEFIDEFLRVAHIHDTTFIGSQLGVNALESDNNVYAMNGQRIVGNLNGQPHGIYIVAGKKIIR